MWNATWDDRPADFAKLRDCWLTRRRVLFVGEFLRKASAGQRVLELGSGVGEVLIALAVDRPDLHFTGIEPQQSYVDFSTEAASRRLLRNLVFRTCPAERIGALFCGDAPFDWLLSNDLLHHVKDEHQVLEAASQVTRSGCEWLAIEPNWRNPYVLVGCALKRGERNFWPKPFLDRGQAKGWLCRKKGFLFLIPPFIKRPPELLISLEKALEHYPLIAGGVALTLVKTDAERESRHVRSVIVERHQDPHRAARTW